MAKTDDKQIDNSLRGYDDDALSSTDNVVSTNECTGLIMAPPTDEAEAEAYTHLYTIPKPENDVPNGLQQKVKPKRDDSKHHNRH